VEARARVDAPPLIAAACRPATRIRFGATWAYSLVEIRAVGAGCGLAFGAALIGINNRDRAPSVSLDTTFGLPTFRPKWSW
jgi:hypothetical protein